MILKVIISLFLRYMMRYFRLLLFPISLIYGLIILIRNLGYDSGLFKSKSFDIPIICVGNLAVGGTGKTPFTEYLVSLLKGKKIAILSRGYGRKTTGFVLADATSTALTIGDEPLQYYHKFSEITVAVCEDRVTGIDRLKDNHDVILLDDGFQHRKVQPGLSILLFDYNSLFRFPWMLPTGNLREPFWGYKRADVVVVTKAPFELNFQQRKICVDNFSEQTSLFFSSIKYGELTALYTKETKNLDKDSVFLLTGISNPSPFRKYLQQQSTIVKEYNFPDHYSFTKKDIEEVVANFITFKDSKKVIITTEKDAQRLLSEPLKKILVNLPIYYVPIRTEIHKEDSNIFHKKIIDYVTSTSRNS